MLYIGTVLLIPMSDSDGCIFEIEYSGYSFHLMPITLRKAS